MKYLIELDYNPTPEFFDTPEEALTAAEKYLDEPGMTIVCRTNNDEEPYVREKVIKYLEEYGEFQLASVGQNDLSGLTLIVATQDHYAEQTKEAHEALNQLAQELADSQNDDVSISVEGKTKTFKPKKKRK